MVSLKIPIWTQILQTYVLLRIVFFVSCKLGLSRFFINNYCAVYPSHTITCDKLKRCTLRIAQSTSYTCKNNVLRLTKTNNVNKWRNRYVKRFTVTLKVVKCRLSPFNSATRIVFPVHQNGSMTIQ